VKAFLNGVSFDQLFSLKTLFVKLVGTICSVGAGLPMVRSIILIVLIELGTRRSNDSHWSYACLEYFSNEV
jgi:hypothetical protein